VGVQAAAPYDRLRAGQARLLEDERILWALARFGPLDGQSVLDLGPLEGGHTYMALQAGARRVVAVEGNARHFL
jgi:predicted RNA methylase